MRGLDRTWCVAAAVFITLLVFGQTGNALSAEKVVLRLNWYHQFQFAGYYAAKEKGFYAEEDLDVDILEHDPAESPIDSILRGNADFGVSDTNLILHRLRGEPVVVLAAIFQHSPLVLLTRAEDNIHDPEDLRGKRVMRQRNVNDAAITALFQQEGIVDSDIIHLPQNFRDDALLDGKTDAVAAYQTIHPFYYENRDVSLRILNPLNYGIDFYGDMLFTSAAMMRDRPNIAQRFRRASIRGWKYALENPAKVIDWLIKQYDTRNSRDHLQFEARITRRMILPKLIEVGHMNRERFNEIAAIYRTQQPEIADATLTGIDYRDHLIPPRKIPDWARWVTGVAAGLALLSLGLLLIARNLRRRVAERTSELRDARDVLQRQLDIIDRHVIMSRADANGIITYASDAFAKISKYPKEELIGQTHALFSHPDTPREIYRELRNASLAGKSWSGEFMSQAKDGSAYWVDITVEPDFDSDGNYAGFTSLRYDISDKKHIEVLSETDRLTGLPNRLKLDETFEHEIARAKRYGHPLSVIIFDIDHFKQVNDSHGHQKGDEVLVGLSWLIQAHIRSADILGRWGGEEFMIVCPETNLEGAGVFAEHLRDAVATHDFAEIGHLAASFGVTEMRPDDSEDDMIHRADAALYRAKQDGGNRVALEAVA